MGRKPVTDNVIVDANQHGEGHTLAELEAIVNTSKKIPFLPVPLEIESKKITRILIGVDDKMRYTIWYDFKDGCDHTYDSLTQKQMDELFRKHSILPSIGVKRDY